MVTELTKEFVMINLCKGKEDDWVWRDVETQEYTVKSVYRKLNFQNCVLGEFKYEVLEN